MHNRTSANNLLIQCHELCFENNEGLSIGVASLGPGGARAPPDFLKISITQTLRSAVNNTRKSEIGKNSVHETFHKNFI